MMDWIDQELQSMKGSFLKRSLRSTSTPCAVKIDFEGREVLNFSSNDYLGLSSEDFLKEAAIRGAKQWGTGSGAARLVCGNLKIHQDLEEATAELKGTEASLLFSSGFAAPMGVIPALVGKGDTVILDKLSHACLIDGAHLNGAQVRVYPHQNLNLLERLLRETKGKKLIVTESVFSMDGDRASLKEIVDLKERYGAWLMVDEAHATGVFGERGGGVIESLGLTKRVEIQMGTYSKALGSVGGYVACSHKIREFLIHKARSFVFSTGNSPITSAVSLEAVKWIQSPEGVKRREGLRKNIQIFSKKLSDLKEGASLSEHQTPIFPWMMGEEERALEVSRKLLEAGYLTVAIRYPTVPPKKARLRISLSAKHTEKQMSGLVKALGQKS